MHMGICLLHRPEVEERVSLGKSTIYRLIPGGHFPAPVSLGVRAGPSLNTTRAPETAKLSTTLDPRAPTLRDVSQDTQPIRTAPAPIIPNLRDKSSDIPPLFHTPPPSAVAFRH